jgi:hypothetical protein
MVRAECKIFFVITAGGTTVVFRVNDNILQCCILTCVSLLCIMNYLLRVCLFVDICRIVSLYSSLCDYLRVLGNGPGGSKHVAD